MWGLENYLKDLEKVWKNSKVIEGQVLWTMTIFGQICNDKNFQAWVQASCFKMTSTAALVIPVEYACFGVQELMSVFKKNIFSGLWFIVHFFAEHVLLVWYYWNDIFFLCVAVSDACGATVRRFSSHRGTTTTSYPRYLTTSSQRKEIWNVVISVFIIGFYKYIFLHISRIPCQFSPVTLGRLELTLWSWAACSQQDHSQMGASCMQ